MRMRISRTLRATEYVTEHIQQRENRGRGTDAKCQGYRGYRGNPSVAADLTNTVCQVLAEGARFKLPDVTKPYGVDADFYGALRYDFP